MLAFAAAAFLEVDFFFSLAIASDSKEARSDDSSSSESCDSSSFVSMKKIPSGDREAARGRPSPNNQTGGRLPIAFDCLAEELYHGSIIPTFAPISRKRL
ncbi:MAG TPA: hypothetical protein DCR94_05010 [Firmicutes bacterium]|nr:hypothetical protein [Bacillota bacterium]